jgi:Fe-S cluster assembly iron-binding protein IscA
LEARASDREGYDFVLSVTTQAASIIKQLTAKAGLGDGGLRIARRPSGYGLCMSLAGNPAPGDVVVAVSDAVLYLDAAARDRLAGHTLDARTNAEGAAFFI